MATKSAVASVAPRSLSCSAMNTRPLSLAALALPLALVAGCSDDKPQAAPAPSGSIKFGDVQFNKDAVKVDRTEVSNEGVKVDGKQLLQNGAHKGADEAMQEK